MLSQKARSPSVGRLACMVQAAAGRPANGSEQVAKQRGRDPFIVAGL
jgi:hypothetical protein